MRTRNAKHGLTSIELLVSLGSLAILVTAGMIFWMRYDREKWRTIAAAEPERVFTLECQPLAAEFHGDLPIECLCEVTNVGPYQGDFRLTGFRFSPHESLRRFTMDWAIVNAPDEAPENFMHSNVTLPIDPGATAMFRLRHDSLFRGPSRLPKFGGAVTLEGSVSAYIRTEVNVANLESNPISLIMHPPERGATESARMPANDSP